MYGKIVVVGLQICTFLTILSAQTSVQDTLFPTPEILKGNVAFWKKIYSEISLNEGLIHDRDYPMIIFERVKGDASSNAVKQRKESIVNALKTISTQPASNWSEKEKQIYKLYMQNADSSALSGAADRVRFQQGQTERFQQGLQRSGMYLDTIRAIFKRYNIPERLIYLPHVESSFNTEAYSKVGAAGLWQFMRGTGKLYGMRIDYTIDERRDPVHSTIAAAKYLSSSYQELKSWPLAITSYNHGVYGIKRAIAQTGSRDLGYIIQNYTSRSFKFASSNFYGCFLAASELAQNHQTYFPNVSLHPPMHYTDFKLTHFIHPEILCKYTNISPEEFIRLNPAIRPAVFKQHKMLPKGFVIHLPIQISSADAHAMLNKIPDSLKAYEPERPQYYRVNKGDNLYAISSRLGVSVNDLVAENNITKKTLIRAGQVLRIPGATEVRPIATAKTTPEKTVQTASNLNKSKSSDTPIPLPDSNATDAIIEIAQAEVQSILPPEENDEPIKLTAKTSQKSNDKAAIKKESALQAAPTPAPAEELSDSLKSIALATAIDLSEAKQSERPVVVADFDVGLYNLDVTLSPVGNSAELTVSIDETIGHYADWLKIPTWRIRKLNDMRNSDIRINSKIKIPVDRQDALEVFAAARLEYHMAIEEDFYTQYKVTDLKALVVKRGQTLWDLCNEGDNPVPLWLLKKHNSHIDLGKLMPGTTVWIPQIAENTGESINKKPVAEPVHQTVPLRDKSQQIKRVP